MDGLGPLEMMFSWQALLCASACVGLTKVPTTIVDVAMGKDKRKSNKWLSKVVFPMLPVVFGIVYASAVPLRPEVLIEYVNEHTTGFWQYIAYAGWGGACGQFSTTLYDKLLEFFRHGKSEP